MVAGVSLLLPGQFLDVVHKTRSTCQFGSLNLVKKYIPYSSTEYVWTASSVSAAAAGFDSCVMFITSCVMYVCMHVWGVCAKHEQIVPCQHHKSVVVIAQT